MVVLCSSLSSFGHSLQMMAITLSRKLGGPPYSCVISASYPPNILRYQGRSVGSRAPTVAGATSASKPNPPIAPRAKRLAATDNEDVRRGNQATGEDGYGDGYEHKGFVRISPSAHLALNI